MRYKILSHTADLRLKIYGQSLEELFANAALGLARILKNDVEKKLKWARGAEKITSEAIDPPTLLVSFLNKILSLSQINKKVYPKVKILYFSPQKVEAQISGFPVQNFDEDIKAVSFHEVKIEKNKNNLLETVVVLDI